MDTRSPIPSAPPSRDRGASRPASSKPAIISEAATLAKVNVIVDAALIRAHRAGSLLGALVASAVYVAIELARALS